MPTSQSEVIAQQASESPTGFVPTQSTILLQFGELSRLRLMSLVSFRKSAMGKITLGTLG